MQGPVKVDVEIRKVWEDPDGDMDVDLPDDDGEITSEEGNVGGI